MRRQTDDNGGQAVVLGRQALDLGRHAIEPRGAVDLQRGQRARERSRAVADRQPDAAAADINPQNPHDPQCYNFRLPNVSLASVSRRTVGAAILLAACLPLFAQQADRARTDGLTERAAGRLQALQQEADRLASDERTLLGDLRRLEVEREIKNEELRQIAAKAATAARDLSTVNDELQRLEREDLAARPELTARVVELYKLGQGRYLRLLLSTSDLRRLGQASRMVAALAKRDQDRVAEGEKRRAELQASRRTLEARERELSTLRVGAERAQAQANRAVAARNELIGSIDRERDLNAQLVSELLAAQQKLQLTLGTLGDRAPLAGAQRVVLPLRPFRGDLEWPVTGTVRRRFGAAEAQGRPPSNGLEIAAAEGAAVQAIHEGTVAFADAFAGFGRLVIIEHEPQAFSLYANLSDMSVARGAHVDEGQELGSVGTSATGAPGLYFELRVDGRPVDPLQWLRKK